MESYVNQSFDLDQIIDKKQCRDYLTEYINIYKSEKEMTDEAFAQIFKEIDTNKDE